MNLQDKAFPNPHLTGETGMTLRDYFAAKAINAFLEDVGWKVGADLFADIAEGAYRMADAMMEARNDKR